MRPVRLLWRLFLPIAALLILTAVSIGWFAGRRLERIHAADASRTLRAQASLLAELARPHLLDPGRQGLQEVLAAVGAKESLRLTVVRADGRVAADSEAHDLGALARHGTEREELREALAEPYGEARRLSDSTRVETLYVAVRVEAGERSLGWARAARAVTALDGEAGELRRVVLGAIAGALVLALVAAYVLAQRLARPVATLTSAVGAMAAGDLTRRLRVRGGRELGELAVAYNRMADELSARMQELAAEKRELGAVLAAMVEGVLAVDEGERVVLINEAGARILGVAPTEVQGRPLWEVVRLREVAETLAAALRDGAPRTSEIRRPGRPHDRVLRLHASPLMAPGDGARGAVLVFHDITELRQLEQVRRDFVANASHELKTPLAAIRGLVETILDDEQMEPATQRRFLGSILAQSERLGELVAEMLALSRLESQSVQLQREPIDLRLPMGEALEPLHALARERGLEFEVSAPPTPLLVLGSHEPLRRIVANLVGNAVKYTPSGGTVRVRALVEDGRGVVEVADTGPGIPSSERERVFERFYRIDKGRSRETGGTGLGLAIVKHLVQGLEGRVRIDDAPGGGALVRVDLPLAPG